MDQLTLQKPIPELGFSDSFKEMAHRYDFKMLQNILNWPVNVLLMHEGFTQHHYQELRNFLLQADGAHLLKTDKS